ncbi:MAG: glycosyltransferase family 2 protein [Lachnospiraceae bacterium]|nr:glycosyltransferase family 2 protein [Lachnospiraceae bacterium]
MRHMLLIMMIIQICAMLFTSWHGFVAFFGLRKARPLPGPGTPQNRFAVVICANNEENVIGSLLDALSRQTYPMEMFHVFLLADHCTDATAEIGRRYPFVTVYEKNVGDQNGKGAVLSWGIKKILRKYTEDFDAFLFFDADNVPAEDFMMKINAHLALGNEIIQGKRLAGRPYKTFVTDWYAIYWPLYNYIYSYSREKLGFSSFLTGTGFAVRTDLLKEYGWRTSSITEDVEWSFKMCMRGHRISFCETAVFYDEQPSTVRAMFPQLIRWCTGSYQILRTYLGEWVRSFKDPSIKRTHTQVCLFDNLELLLMGPVQIVSTFAGAVAQLIMIDKVPKSIPFIILGFLGTYIGTLAAAYFITRFCGITIREIRAGFFTFPIFLAIYTLCSLIALLRPQTKWVKVVHEGITERKKDDLSLPA